MEQQTEKKNEEKKEFDVFISYSHNDRTIAEGICEYLDSQQIRYYIDYKNIHKGHSHSQQIPRAIRRSGLLLAVFSKDFNASEDTDNEITVASHRHIPILVFRITEDDFDGTKEYYLTKSNWIEAFPEPEKCFGELYNSICLLLGIRNESTVTNIENVVDKLSFKKEEDLVQKGLIEFRKFEGDKLMAAYYIRKAAKNGYPEAEYLLGRIYSEGRGLPHSWENAFYWLNIAVEHGNGKAMYWLGRFYHYGIYTERNIMRALELYTKSADLGYGRAAKELGRVLHTGELGLKDEKRSAEYYNEAFDILLENALGENDAECQYVLGDSYLDGAGVAKNYNIAIQLYQKAANNCYANSYNSLGFCYEWGLGVDKDEVKSHALELKAANLGLPIAMGNIAKDYYFGRGVEKSLDEYHKWVYRAAECGSHTALYSIGLDYYLGEICEKDMTKACKWLENAIKSGSLQAMWLLGRMFEDGDIGETDGKQKAFELYKQAAMGGHITSYFNLGDCYYHGIGTDENDVEARRWYLKIADAYEIMLNAEEDFIIEHTGLGNVHHLIPKDNKELFANAFTKLAWIYRNSTKVEHEKDAKELAGKYERMAEELNPNENSQKIMLE